MRRIVEAMMRCDGLGPAYLVVSLGGVCGVGERLYPLNADEFQVVDGRISASLALAGLEFRRSLDPENWPSRIGQSAPNQ